MLDYKKYLQEISEGLNSPLSINWLVQEPEHWYGNFNIRTHKYQIFIDNFSKKEKQFLFKFKGDFSFDLMNDVKSAMTTIPTIEKAAIDFLKIENPNAFIFCDSNDSLTRRTMYDRFCHKMKKELKYKYEKHELSEDLIFYTLLKNCDEQELNKSIMKIVQKISS